MNVNCLKISVLFFCVIRIGSSAYGSELYGGDGGRQFTEIDQINQDNVDQLGEAWVFRTGDLNQDFARKGHSFQATPIFWNNTLYISTSANWVIAVNAATGEEIWRFDPELPKDIGYSESASRGVSLWHGDSAVCPSRIFIGTLVGELHALDAVTGLPCDDFGNHGTVDLSKGVGDVDIGDYSITSPPAVIGDQIIVGSAIGDNRAVQSERGIVRAMDARSGEIRWVWDPIPRTVEDPAYQTWAGESAALTGSANAWAPLSAWSALLEGSEWVETAREALSHRLTNTWRSMSRSTVANNPREVLMESLRFGHTEL